jgi:two-component system phosphate regulon sensor histidine kinase PhoR
MFNSIELKFFVIFSLDVFAIYTVIDLISNKELQSLGLKFFTDYSLSEQVLLVTRHTLQSLREASFLSQFIIYIFTFLSAYGLMRFVVRPIELVHKKQKYFAANASHELRTPLSVLKTSAEVARMYKDSLTPEQVHELTESVIEEVDRMSNIIEFFLHFSALEGEVKPQMSSVNIAHLPKKVVHMLSGQAQQSGVALEIRGREQAIVWGNLTAIEEMIMNLTKNAITHSSPGGAIRLSIEEVDHHVLLQVSDEGYGISDKDLPHIFEAFYKGSDGRKAGSGLGLTIVCEIAKMHHAIVNVKTALGKGSVFTVRFPK